MEENSVRGGERRIEREKWRDREREKERGEKNEDEVDLVRSRSSRLPRGNRRQYILGQVGGYTEGRKWEILGRKARIYNEV